LLDAGSDRLIRSFTAQEMVIRYGCPISLDVNMPVDRQLQALEEIRTWAEANVTRFRPGHWYFGGRALEGA
jgi:hypothetical protein